MAVYTDINEDELAGFMAGYDLGDVLAFKGIAEGVSNSNFLLTTTRGQFILTLFEARTNAADLPFFVGLMDYLAAKGISCPTPVHGRDGAALRDLAGKPAIIVTFLNGLSIRRPTPDHCAELGRALALLHRAGDGFSMTRVNDLSLPSWRPMFTQCADRADMVRPGLAGAIETELDYLEGHWPAAQALPGGVIHADLFPDNVFFRGNSLSGLIDFYFACTDMLAYDLAVCLNAWCFEADFSFNATKARQMIAAYQALRPLGAAERAALPLLCRGAAMRFLLTRLYDWLNQVEGALVKPKDPLDYLKRLQFHQHVAGPAAYGL